MTGRAKSTARIGAPTRLLTCQSSICGAPAPPAPCAPPQVPPTATIAANVKPTMSLRQRPDLVRLPRCLPLPYVCDASGRRVHWLEGRLQGLFPRPAREQQQGVLRSPPAPVRRRGQGADARPARRSRTRVRSAAPGLTTQPGHPLLGRQVAVQAEHLR